MASGCDPCGKSPIHYNKKSVKPLCGCGDGCIDCSNIVFTGVDLTCTGVNTNENLENILIAIDNQICSIVGDYSTYDFNCLADDYTITTEAEFVDAITEYVCSIREDFDGFITSTYPSAVNNLQSQINQITSPNLSLCSYTGVLISDTLNTVITKLGSKICELDSRLDISEVTWSNCFTIPSPEPSTIPQAFQLVADQICQVANSIVQPQLPTFNNQGSCLPSPGTADTLVQTIIKIKSRLCETTTYNIDDSPWGCITNPAPGTGPNIQDAFDALLPVIDNLYGNRYTFDTNQFNLTPNGAACDGFVISLDPSVGISDRLVAATVLDTNPGTLQDKLDAGTNITLDYTDPEKVTINSTFTDQNVKVNVSDPSAGFLSDKVTGGSSNGLAIATTVVSNQVQIAPTIDWAEFTNQMMNFIQSDVTAYQQWCNLNCGCGPCTEPEPETASQWRVQIINESLTDEIQMKMSASQNNPTLAYFNAGYIVSANSTYTSGYYNFTTTDSPKTIYLTLNNPTYGTLNYDIVAEVVDSATNALIAGSSTHSATTFANYSNPSFSMGSSTNQITLRIKISSVVSP